MPAALFPLPALLHTDRLSFMLSFSNGFNKARDRLQGKIELTDDNIAGCAQGHPHVPLEADVQYCGCKNLYRSRSGNRARRGS